MAEETGEARRFETLLALAAEAEPQLIGSDDAVWMDRLERDHDGLRAAFSWFLKHGKGAEALQLAADLWLFQEQRGHADEARDWLAKSLAAPGAEARTVTRARALYGAGILAFRKLDADAARRAFGRAWKSHTSEGTGTSPPTNWSGSGGWRWRKGVPRARLRCSRRPGRSSTPPALRWIRTRGRNMRRD